MPGPGAESRPDVLVVGAGPVGLALAIDLARRGTAVRVIDALAAPTTESRAIVLHSRTLDHLEALGVLDAIMSRAIVSTAMEFHSDGRTIAQISFEGITAVHPYSVSLLQTDTEAVLAARLAELGVEVERSTRLTGCAEGDDEVTAAVTGPDGVELTIRARYLVGTDGAASTVRHLIGERLDGSFVGEDFLLGDVEGDHGYERSHFHTFFSPGDTTGLLFPLPGDRVRVFAQLPSGTDPDRQVSVDWLQQALDDRGIALRINRARWLARFELKHGQVPRYRSGRVFLAGDAAHIHSPAGGLGMNTGIHDAVNLGWKLATAVASEGAEALLDSYHSERHPVGAAVIAFSTRLSRVGTLSNPVARRVRNTILHLGLDIAGIADRMAGSVEQQRVGYLDSPVVGGDGKALRPGEFLYLPHADVAAALAGTTGHLVILLPSARFAQPLPDGFDELAISEQDAGELARETGLADGGVVVVRPDGYIGFIGADPDAGIADYLRSIGG